MNAIYQQGDVILRRMSAMPDRIEKLNPNQRGWVLAEGETTGHAHVIEDIGSCELYEDSDGVVWVKVNGTAKLTHEEHHAQEISQGIYKLEIVKEIDPFSEEINKVRD